VLAKKGDKNFRRGMDYEAAQRWDKAPEYTLAVAADPSNMEYQMHFAGQVLNASQLSCSKARRWQSSANLGSLQRFFSGLRLRPENELADQKWEMLYRAECEGRKPTNTKRSREAARKLV